MAGRGPAPKPKSQRRNQSVPQRGEWVDLGPLAKPVLPTLAPRGDGEDWSASSQAMWDAWRADPVTTQWSPSDVAYACETIELREARGMSVANELRLRMDGLGLTPKGKRDLRFRIGGDAAPTASRSQSPSRARHLRAVDTKAG